MLVSREMGAVTAVKLLNMEGGEEDHLGLLVVDVSARYVVGVVRICPRN